MSLQILAPRVAAPAYRLAAQAFRSMYAQVTGKTLPIVHADDGCSDLYVIGSDSVNDYVMDRVLDLELNTLPLRYGTDDYCLLSHKDGNRKVLILAGGRGRSTLYAVYDYFERYADCHYFWDGDVIGHHEFLPMEDIRVSETPRFDYRGTRYFAHRGLKRFQAEHWSFDDWKRELDWLVKKRMNFFMLRIGMDDIWQKAFPQDVPYPEGFQNMDAVGFHDRSDFAEQSFQHFPKSSPKSKFGVTFPHRRLDVLIAQMLQAILFPIVFKSFKYRFRQIKCCMYFVNIQFAMPSDHIAT